MVPVSWGLRRYRRGLLLHQRRRDAFHHQLLIPVETTITLAGVDIALITPCAVQVTEAFRPFLNGGGQQRFPVTFQEVDALPAIPGTPVFQNLSFQAYGTGAADHRLYWDHKEGDRPYAVGRLDPANGRETVWYLPGDRRFFSQTSNCFAHLALERLLLERDRLILHASYIAAPQGAVLFSGPSGIGKSTQAALWERFRNARLINGDRVILSRETAGWMAHGSPYAGSSRCFRNESHPIRAVVMLRQGPVCTVRRLRGGTAFQRLYAGITVNAWNPACVERVCGLLAAMAVEVPVLELTCTPDETAVRVLEAQLQKEGCGEWTQKKSVMKRP